MAIGGTGCYLIDADGKYYLDASSGAAVSCLGHGHPAVIEAIQRQAGKLAYASTSFFTNEPTEQLAEFLIKDAPAGLTKAYFVSGGSEAIESALKLARQYFLEIGQPQRRHFVARRQSYHGNTLGALAVGGHVARRAPYEPLLTETSHIAPCYAYRGQRTGETEEAYGRRVADELETLVLSLGEDSVIAFVAEPVVGATLGAVPAVPGYFRRVREICDRYGILLILDEIMCGMGRTGTLHASTHEQIVPDLQTIAKGLGGGYQPIGALLVSEKIDQALRQGSGEFQHGYTYVGHALACAAALAVQQTIQSENLVAMVRQRGGELSQALHDAFKNHPYVGDIRGRGLFLALEIVQDRSSKEPFARECTLSARIKRQAFSRGLLCYPMPGTVDGWRGDHVLLAPPYIISQEQIGELVEKLSLAIDAAIAEA